MPGDPESAPSRPNWTSFWDEVCNDPSSLLRGLHPGLRWFVDEEGSEGDAFYSDAIQGELEVWWVEGNRQHAVRCALEVWLANVKRRLRVAIRGLDMEDEEASIGGIVLDASDDDIAGLVVAALEFDEA